MILGCPGQDNRFIKADIIVCPNCGHKIEIFSDEISAKCTQCKTVVQREVLPSCIEWCKSARSCVGEARYNKYIKEKAKLVKD